VYATLGELPAVLAALALSLECGVSGAAVARSWGAKIASLRNTADLIDLNGFEDRGFNVYACLLQCTVIILFLQGVELGKVVTNVFTIVKVLVVLVIVVSGLCFFQPANLKPLMPLGLRGVLKGSTSCFFGFIGYDEVSYSSCYFPQLCAPTDPYCCHWRAGVLSGARNGQSSRRASPRHLRLPDDCRTAVCSLFNRSIGHDAL
jgi:amino acid transporter